MYSPAASAAGGGSRRQTAMDVNRSLRSIKNELETLLEKGAITDDAFQALHNLLPQEWSLRGGGPSPAASASPATPAGPAVPSEAAATATDAVPARQPALPPRNHAPTPTSVATPGGANDNDGDDGDDNNNGRSIVGYATTKYAYEAPSDGDLAFARGDSLAVYSKVNDDWWLGRNVRTGDVGIFPRQYVKPEAVLADLERTGRLPSADDQPAAPAVAQNRWGGGGSNNNSNNSNNNNNNNNNNNDRGRSSAPPPYYDAYGNPPPPSDPKYPSPQPYGQPSYGQPPYGQPPYGQFSYSQQPPYNYGQAPYGQPPPPPPPQQQQQPPGDHDDNNGHGQGQGSDKWKASGKKIGGKFGNAFITGAGFAAGADVVNSIL
ncbi:sh3 domain containing protein [Niveomyces insectorum RCEF 264]|uniref:Sh3 domain containing protein n=1 Tax=Niveomyces insectorum RCEF 264 TaxID=1081102 RepID=A0A167LXQ7_9HYPO|nr:sh3 domain containing protein [Niveomyces insectorum RCEF 264]